MTWPVTLEAAGLPKPSRISGGGKLVYKLPSLAYELVEEISGYTVLPYYGKMLVVEEQAAVESESGAVSIDIDDIDVSARLKKFRVHQTDSYGTTLVVDVEKERAYRFNKRFKEDKWGVTWEEWEVEDLKVWSVNLKKLNTPRRTRSGWMWYYGKLGELTDAESEKAVISRYNLSELIEVASVSRAKAFVVDLPERSYALIL